MSVAAIAHYMLPDTPYEMWVRGELDEYLRLPDDGTKVEVVGGEIVVSPSPSIRHNNVVRAIDRAMLNAETNDPAFPWTFLQTTDLDLVPVKNGYAPDMIILAKETDRELEDENRQRVLPREVEAVVEVTSPSNASNDRPPLIRQAGGTKWACYARVGIPFYLLVDRDPRCPEIALYGEPDIRTGTYETLQTWQFGETVKLPDPLGFTFDTERWKPWAE